MTYPEDWDPCPGEEIIGCLAGLGLPLALLACAAFAVARWMLGLIS